MARARSAARAFLVSLASAALLHCGGSHAQAHTQLALADCGGIDACVSACDQARGSSCYAAGSMYETGSGAPQSYPDAARFYSRACDTDDPRGCNDLGVMHEIGLAGPQDYTAAASLYDRACKGGDAQGCSNLALRYEEGLGVPKDRERARALRQQACSLGVALACRQND